MWPYCRNGSGVRRMAVSVSEEVKYPFSIVKVVSPDSYVGIWNQVVKNKRNQQTFYEFQDELNDYYCTVGGCSSSGFSLPRIGQLSVIRHPKDRQWYRATAENVLEDSSGYRVIVFLVDKAETVSVSIDWVRKITETFTQFPFQACLLELPGIYPRSMQCDPDTATMLYSRASKWDTAAIRYIDGLIKGHSKAEIRVICYKDGCGVVGDLYLHNEDGAVVCVRSSLVSLGFAIGSQAKYFDDTTICPSVENVLPSLPKPKITTDKQLNESIKLQSELDKKFEDIEACESNDDMPTLAPLSPDKNFQFTNENSDVLYRNRVSTTMASLNNLLKQASSISSSVSSCKISLSSSSSHYSTSSDRNSVSSEDRVRPTTIGRGRAMLESHQRNKGRLGNVNEPSLKPTSPRGSDGLTSVVLLAAHGRGIRKSITPEQQNVNQLKQRDKLEGDVVAPGDCSRLQFHTGVESQVVSSARNGAESQVVSSARNDARDVLLATASNASVGRNCLLSKSVETDRRTEQKIELSRPTICSNGGTNRLLFNSVLETKDVSKIPVGKSVNDSSAENTIRPVSVGRGHQLLSRILNSDEKVAVKKKGFHKENGVVGDVVLSRHHYVKPPTMPYFSTSMDKPLDIVTKSKFRKVLVCGPMQPEPLGELKDAKFDNLTYKRLTEMKVVNPRTIQAFVWPALTRGRNVVAISPPGSGKSIAYIAYLLSRIKEKTLYADLPKNHQPVALILCATWQKAKSVYDTACFIANGSRDTRVFLIYGGGYDESRMEYLIDGCDLLVATPCSLLRLMKRDGYKPTGFTRLCYFVIDDADILTDKFREQIKELLNLYKEQFNQRPNKATSLAQIMTFGTRWTEMLKSFIRSSLFTPLMISSSYCENAVYAGIKTFAHVCKAEDRFQHFFDEIILPYHKINNRKTLICTSHRSDALNLFRVMVRICPFTLVAHHGMGMVDLQGVSQKWREGVHRPGEIPILIATDSCLENLNIEDVECLIHYDVPELTKSQFGRRFCSMMKYMRRSEVVPRKSDDSKLSNAAGCVTRLIITETSYVPAHSLIHFLKRLDCVIPKCLIALASGYYQYKEEQKTPIPLCYFVKAFGKCPDLSRCIDRHILSKTVDSPSEHLLRGVEIVLRVTCVRNASQLYGRVVKHKEKDGTWKIQNAAFLSLSMGMAMYFSNPVNQIPCEIKLGDILAVCVDSVYYRVRVMYKDHVNEENVREVQAFFIDDGRLDYIAVSRFLCLPGEFSSVPPQAFEIFLSNVRPIDSDKSWTDKSVIAVEKMAAGSEMTGKIAFSLGNTLWLSSLTKQTRIIKTDVDIEHFDVCKELLNLRFAMENPDQLRNLEIFASKMFVLHPPIVYDTTLEVAESFSVQERTVSSSFLPLEELVDVYVSCVVDPGRIYLQKEQFCSSLDTLMDDIDKHAKSGKAKRLKDLSEGMLCLAPLPTDNNSYYRAQIIKIDSKEDGVKPDDEVVTFYVDYGDTSQIRAGDLLHLDDTFLWKLPFQAIECRLANISPLDGAKEWSEEISNNLYHMSFGPNGTPQIMTVKALKKAKSLRTFGNFYDVALYDTSDCGFNNVVDNLNCLKLVEDVSTTSAAVEDDATRLQNEVQMEENKPGTVKEALANGVNGQFASTNKETDFAVVPYVLWAQQSDNVRLTIKVASVKEENQFLNIEGTNLSFSATANKVKYQLRLELFELVKVDRFDIMETYVRVVLKKLHCKKWPRLTAKKEKLFFLSVDFDYCMDSSDEEHESWPQCETPASTSTNFANGLPPDPKIDFSDNNDADSDSDDDSSICLDIAGDINDGYEDFL